MIRHISVFILKKEEKTVYRRQVERLAELLKEIPKDVPEIIHCRVGTNLSNPLKEQSKGGPVFGDVVQILDFADRDAAGVYPSHPAHIHLIHLSEKWVEQVIAIDFEV